MNRPDGLSSWWCANGGSQIEAFAVCYFSKSSGTFYNSRLLKQVTNYGGGSTVVSCPSGYELLSGGCFFWGYPEVFKPGIVKNKFVGTEQWECNYDPDADDDDDGNKPTRAYAICADTVYDHTIKIIAPIHSHNSRASCPSNRFLFGCGCQVWNHSPDNLYTYRNLPDAYAGACNCKYMSDDTDVRPFAVCSNLQ